MTIRSVTSGCTCTVPRVSYTDPDSGEVVHGSMTRTGSVLKVPPGAIAAVELRVDTQSVAQKNIDKLEQVRIATDSVNRAYIDLELHLIVELAFSAVPRELHLGTLPRSAGGAGRVEIVPVPGSGARLTGIAELPAGVLAELTYDPMQGRPRWWLDVALEPPLEVGEVTRSIPLSTEGPDGEGAAPFHVVVVARGDEDVSATPSRLVLRGSPPSGEIELSTGIPTERLLVRETEVRGAQSAHLTASAEALEPDGEGRSSRWRVSLAAASDVEAASFSGVLVVRVQGSAAVGTVEKEIPYVGFR